MPLVQGTCGNVTGMADSESDSDGTESEAGGEDEDGDDAAEQDAADGGRPEEARRIYAKIVNMLRKAGERPTTAARWACTSRALLSVLPSWQVLEHVLY